MPTTSRPSIPATRLSARSHALTFILVVLAVFRFGDGPGNAGGREKSLAAPKLAAIDSVIEQGMKDGHYTGAVVAIRHGNAHYRKAFGLRAVDPVELPMELDTIFDAASLTKVTATAPSIMLLADHGRLDLDAPVARYIPEFTGGGKESIRIRHLLTHTSGLRPILPRQPPWQGAETAIRLASAEATTTTPGTAFRYSDINYIVLGEVVRRVSGEPLDQFARRQLFEPLGMMDTGFLPERALLPRIAPTERTESEGLLHGVVHDPSARSMDGVAGHAGLFTTMHDLSRYATMLLNRGRLGDVRILSAGAVKAMTTDQTPRGIDVRRGFGWDIESGFSHPKGEHFSDASFGHTGWTGQAIWIDPAQRGYLILLTTRNHPFERKGIKEIQREVATLAAEAMDPSLRRRSPSEQAASPATSEPNAQIAESAQPHSNGPAAEPGSSPAVRNGIDTLRADEFKALDGLAVGLVTNHTGVAADGTTTIDLLHAAPGVDLRVLFSPEHGIRGTEDTAVVDDSRDRRTGLPVVSLYKGGDRKPKTADLDGLDALVFDIQDIGTRFYTYISTMGLCMEAAEEQGLKFIVLDRINPIGGEAVEGPLPAGENPYSFTAFHSIPVRHGMTVGELASLFRAERCPGLELKVVPVKGWRRAMAFGDTGLQWINPSPNMRSPAAALLYPGIGLMEFSNVSVGRGTATPFEWMGAPFIEPDPFVAALAAEDLPGVRFHPARFTPDSSVHVGARCGGVRFEITDRVAFRPVRTGLTVARTLIRLYPDAYKPEQIARLLVHPPALAALRAGSTEIEEIERLWRDDLEAFLKRRRPHLIYR